MKNIKLYVITPFWELLSQFNEYLSGAIFSKKVCVTFWKNVYSMTTLFFLFFLFSCDSPKEPSLTDMVNIPASANKGLNTENLPLMKFDEEIFDFGSIIQGDKVSHDFKFKNVGADDLIISNAYADCGCTVAEVPKKPIPSGEASVIRVTFDSNKKTGIVTKSISIITNCIPNKQVIKIKANIIIPQPETK